MNIGKNYEIIESICKYFIKDLADGMICEILKILKILKTTSSIYDVESCLFFEDKILSSKCKFQIFSDDVELLSSLLISIDVHSYELLKESLPLKGIQFVFDSGGEIVEYALNYVSYTDDSIKDISYKTFVGEESIVREYIHQFSKNYINDTPITKFQNIFLIKDVVILQKKFFNQNIKSCYLFFPNNRYFSSDFEEIFGILTPNFITNFKMSSFCMCVDKQELDNNIFSKFSIYFGTYGS